MANWRWKVDIAEVLRDEDASPYQKAQRIAAEIRKCRAPDADTWAEELAAIPEDADADDFDCVWDQVYDWADEYRVWLNPF